MGVVHNGIRRVAIKQHARVGRRIAGKVIRDGASTRRRSTLLRRGTKYIRRVKRMQKGLHGLAVGSGAGKDGRKCGQRRLYIANIRYIWTQRARIFRPRTTTDGGQLVNDLTFLAGIVEEAWDSRLECAAGVLTRISRDGNDLVGSRYGATRDTAQWTRSRSC